MLIKNNAYLHLAMHDMVQKAIRNVAVGAVIDPASPSNISHIPQVTIPRLRITALYTVVDL